MDLNMPYLDGTQAMLKIKQKVEELKESPRNKSHSFGRIYENN
jgi:CheY-like chemotaxis protein